jgi:hypothetical protein
VDRSARALNIVSNVAALSDNDRSDHRRRCIVTTRMLRRVVTWP